MCGIVGYIGFKQASPLLLDGLSRLEYRGYDSAGIATLGREGIEIHRAEGKLSRLVADLSDKMPEGSTGIAHTRWATHGRPSQKNAHPHRAGRVVLVHNGIVENFQSLKKDLSLRGAECLSETDTEIICHTIHRHLTEGLSFLEAFKKALGELRGTYGLAVLDTENPDLIYVAKKGSPLVIGLGEGENFVASDVPAILPYTREVIFLEDGEMALISAKEVVCYGADFEPLAKKTRTIDWTPEMAEKCGYKHFMLKEIFEQPRVIEDTLNGRLNKSTLEIDLPELAEFFSEKPVDQFTRIYFVACGTSWHAAMAGRYLIEAIAKIPVAVDTASEFRYREPFIDNKTLLLVISQSGETADTLACVQDAKVRGASVISICNVVDASIPRASHACLYTRAGPEIGVASTKAFTTQLVLMLVLALHWAKLSRTRDEDYIHRAVSQLARLPKWMNEVLKKSEEVLGMAKKFVHKHDVYFIARGVHYPIALEGALKLKEISYMHAEGYAAGEMKHGPIALLENGMPVVALAPSDRVCEKMISNIEESMARGAHVFAIVTEGDKRFDSLQGDKFYLPPTAWYITPILEVLPLQLLAYYMADLRDADVDQPRNLAKSVTVE